VLRQLSATSCDSEFVTGDIVSKAAVVNANKQLAAEGKNLISYTQLLLGITKVSIWSDSWLSAASFQDTTRVLINAAVSGRADHLHGLKENVIIGRKIPVGTGAVQRTRNTERRRIRRRRSCCLISRLRNYRNRLNSGAVFY